MMKMNVNHTVIYVIPLFILGVFFNSSYAITEDGFYREDLKLKPGEKFSLTIQQIQDICKIMEEEDHLKIWNWESCDELMTQADIDLVDATINAYIRSLNSGILDIMLENYEE